MNDLYQQLEKLSTKDLLLMQRFWNATKRVSQCNKDYIAALIKKREEEEK